jgi:hypothetical protein
VAEAFYALVPLLTEEDVFIACKASRAVSKAFVPLLNEGRAKNLRVVEASLPGPVSGAGAMQVSFDGCLCCVSLANTIHCL